MRVGTFGGSWALPLLALFSLSGCVGQHDSELRWSEQLGEARAEAALQRARALELSEHLARLAERVSASSSLQAHTNRALMERLDQLVLQNQRLIAAQSARDAAQATATAGAVEPAEPEASLSEAREASPESELRALVERWRAQAGWHEKPLTREQNQALRVLLKPERKLDSEVLWPGGWY